MEAWRMPRVTSRLMYSKWGVSPRITAPRQNDGIEPTRPSQLSGNQGISNAPGTRQPPQRRPPPRLSQGFHTLGQQPAGDELIELVRHEADRQACRVLGAFTKLHGMQHRVRRLMDSGACVEERGESYLESSPNGYRFRPHQVVGFRASGGETRRSDRLGTFSADDRAWPFRAEIFFIGGASEGSSIGTCPTTFRP